MNRDDVKKVDESNIGLLPKAIGSKFINSKIYKDGLSLKGYYKDENYLKNINTKNYLEERDQLILEFLSGCCNVDYKEQSNNIMLFTIAVTIEMIYFIHNLNLILPYCFLINLLQSFVSGSKKVSILNGKVTPGTGYTTYKSWLKNFWGNKIE